VSEDGGFGAGGGRVHSGEYILRMCKSKSGTVRQIGSSAAWRFISLTLREEAEDRGCRGEWERAAGVHSYGYGCAGANGRKGGDVDEE
jgi:hypothetical protein